MYRFELRISLLTASCHAKEAPAPAPASSADSVDVSKIGQSDSECCSETEAIAICRIMSDSQPSVQVADEQLMETRRHHLDLVKNAITPHKKLPPDVIAEIFALCADKPVRIPFSYMCFKSSEFCHLPTQVIVSHVCSEWRRIALTTTNLWNDIRLFQLQQKSASVLEEYIARSGNSLSSLDYFPSDDAPNSLLQAKLLRVASTHRFVMLRLEFPLDLLPHFDSFPRETVSHLETLKLTLHTVDQKSPLVIVMPRQKFPRLEHVEIEFVDGYVDLQQSVIPYEQLLTLKIAIVHTSHLAILGRCSSMKECTLALKWKGLPATNYDDDYELFLPQLERLTLENGGKRNILHSLLRVIRCPKLYRLFLTDFDLVLTADVCELMVQRLNLRNLHEFHIFSSNVTNIGPLLERALSLRALSIQETEIAKETMDKLATGDLCPSLTDLHVDFDCDWDEVLTMAELRWKSATTNLQIRPLECIELGKLFNLTEDCERRRDTLQAQGTSIDTVYNSDLI